MNDSDKPAMVSVMSLLPEDVYEWLRSYSRELDISMSAVLRSLVIAHRSNMRDPERTYALLDHVTKTAQPTETAYEVFESGRDCEPDGSVVDVLGEE
jgi:hypothetical protein